MNLNELKYKAADFSDRKFGADNPPTAAIHHLDEEQQELLECFEKGEDPLDEFADCFLMLIDAFRKYYGDDVDMQKLIDACSDKLDVCETRVWGKPDDRGVYKHIKKCEHHQWTYDGSNEKEMIWYNKCIHCGLRVSSPLIPGV